MTATELSNYGTALPNLVTPIAANGDKRTPIAGGSNSSDTQASVAYGLPALMSEPLDDNGIPVPRQDLNGLYNMLSKVTHYLMAGGKIPWSQDESTAIGGYPNGAEVSYSGHNYKSLEDSNTALPTDATKWECIDYLQLTGGTMSGTITIDNNIPVNGVSDNTSRLHFTGGGTFENGSLLLLTGKDSVGAGLDSGMFMLRASDGTNKPSLSGYPNGKLEWSGKNIVRSVNGIDAGTDGNVSIQFETRTTLFYNASGQDGGDITLSQSWRGFKYLIVTGGTDNGASAGVHFIDVDSMKFAVDNSKAFIIYCDIYGRTAFDFWEIKSTTGGTTDTRLKENDQSCRIYKIVGVK